MVRKSEELMFSYASGYRPTLVITFHEYQKIGFGFSSSPRKTVEFDGIQRGNRGEKWIEWGNFGVNFYFTTNKGKSWKDAIKFAKSWITRNSEKGTIKSVDVIWERR